MPKKQLSNLGHLMEILSITAVELSNVIKIDQTSVSRWRTGSRKLSADMPYFEQIVSYCINKNKQLGTELLESFFETIKQNKKRIHKDYLKKCIQSYILNFSDSRISDSHLLHNQKDHHNQMKVTMLTGASGRMSMFINLLEAAEQLKKPTVLKLLEADLLMWGTINMQSYITFYKKMKGVMNLGHKIEFIVQISSDQSDNLMMHQMFLDLVFHENFTLYIHVPKNNKMQISSIYLLLKQMVVVGHYFNDNLDNMLSCTYYNSHYAQVQERVWEDYRSASTAIPVISTHSEFKDIFAGINASSDRQQACYHAGKALSLATMSEALFAEILASNHLTKAQQKQCWEFYYLLRKGIEHSKQDEMGGFYFILDEITAPLAYPTITQYALSGITGKLVEISRAQYLRHFQDTAELLLRDKRYRIFLHYSLASTPIPVSLPKYIWHKHESWVVVVNIDEYTGRAKFMFGDILKTLDVFSAWFSEIYEKVPDYKKENAYVADLFMRIANGEKI